MQFVSVHLVNPYSSTDAATTLKKSYFIFFKILYTSCQIKYLDNLFNNNSSNAILPFIKEIKIVNNIILFDELAWFLEKECFVSWTCL